MGKEFVNLVSTIITFRLLKAVSKTNLLDKMSFGDLEVENLNQKRTNRKDLKVVLRRSYLHPSTAICESFNKFIFENRILIAGYALQSL